MFAPAAAQEVDVLIAGAGPAGMSTALHLCQADPQWAARILVVDKAVFPREKLCGGGVTRPGIEILTGLGLELEPQHIDIAEVRLLFGNVGYALAGGPAFHVVRRAEFDHWLVQQAQRRGIEVRQGVAVSDVKSGADAVEVLVGRQSYRAQVLVAADGSNGIVRRSLQWDDGGRKARLLEVLTAEHRDHPAFHHGQAVFDFTPMHHGLQGYYWDFPSLVDGQPFMNRGVYDSRVVPSDARVDLKGILAAQLQRRQISLEDHPLKGHPVHWFSSRAPLSRPRILLTGDAAGADPLLGEGISFALAYGQVAARAIISAFTELDFHLSDYAQEVLSHPHLRSLQARGRAAALLYRLSEHPHWAEAAWPLAPALLRLVAWRRPSYVPVASPRLIRVD